LRGWPKILEILESINKNNGMDWYNGGRRADGRFVRHDAKSPWHHIKNRH
jgi:hypothetical protein